jgi:acyl-homoserine lactone synthase
MVHIVNSGNALLYREELKGAYHLRHRVFVEERHWEALRKPDGFEIDQFDTPSAIHLLKIERQSVVGYSRLLPSMEPHLLSDVYPYLAERAIPRGPSIFEWTRYCVAPEKRGDSAIGGVGSSLLYGVLAYALEEGITKLTMETDPIWMTRFFDFGFSVEPLGLPHMLEGEPVIALAIDLTEQAVQKCRRMLRLKPLRLESRADPAPAVPLRIAA